MARTASDAEQVLRDYAETWNDRDYDRIADVVSASFVHASPAVPDREARGPDGVEAFMREVTTGFPDFEVQIRDVLARDETVMAEHEFTMTHDGPFAGVPPTGNRVEVRSMAIGRVEDGKLQELREYLDVSDVFEQMGVTTDTAAGREG